MESPEGSVQRETMLSSEGREPLRVVGIGASAGGLSALEVFFENCPCDSGAAFVVIQHLSPKHESLMADLLSRHTKMPVAMIEADQRVERDHVYLIPPGAEMRIEADVLKLSPRSEALSLPIDIFFTSLAQALGPRAIGIVLSGTGSDGTRGAISINDAGGLVLIQDPEESKFDSMPLSVKRAGVVDACLRAAELAERALSQKAAPPKLRVSAVSQGGEQLEEKPADTPEDDASVLEQIFLRLIASGGVDFRDYKSTTILRRLARRMQIQRVSNLADYLEILSGSEVELMALRREFLISVTRFFRDDAAFRALEEKVIPRIVEGLAPRDTARVWVAGCATGEEAYSIAMLFHEAFERAQRLHSLKVFATDVSEDSLQVAAAGVYPDSIAAEVSPARLERFFTQDHDTLVVSPELRQSLIFARHNLLQDPPFTRMDLVSCRNTLIYLRPKAQQSALNRLRFAAKSGGFLFLGHSESLGLGQARYETVDASNKIFRLESAGSAGKIDLAPPQLSRAAARSNRSRRETRGTLHLSRPSGMHPSDPDAMDIALDSAFRTLLDTWAPPSILVNDHYEALHFHGDVSPFLRTRSGKATLDLARLLPEAMAAVASVLICKAVESGSAHVSEPTKFSIDDVGHVVRLHAVPVVSPELPTPCVLLSFERVDADGPGHMELQQIDLLSLESTRIEILERQLEATRADLQSAIQELETSNEELQATNEELMASNEELQSSNEELQSVNEEINTVNAEYQEKISLLNRLNADLGSMLRAVGIATVFVDEMLLITRFSPDASKIFKLRDSDVGRPLGDITHRLRYPSLVDDIHDTIRTEDRCEREVIGDDGEIYLVRIVPYAIKASGQRGAVVTVMNVTVYRNLAKLQGIIDALPEHIAVLDFDGTILLTNAAWIRFAKANGDPDLKGSGPGSNYLEVCRGAISSSPPRSCSEDMRSAVSALEGVKEILEGSRTSFSLEYPCHSSEQKRWFFMTVAPVVGQNFGAVVSHIEITPWKDQLAGG
ncbi:chemotaxis protein CheB [Rhodovulum steppense]|uniref:Two-component system CheB/CheR fusion protein n=1 Tax=Rhodovulum steppense TaxID=540251 RepID=A0A4R1YI36_9RHOB|nr:chemotaxis protein CheB [Rhodovulum steppense]TCM75901.1 two-component system CheB/CheR fusion protein [Rhodovulum steppense]